MILKRFSSDICGAVALEFIVVMPFFMLLLLGGVEASRDVLLHQKLNRAASSVANIVAMAPSVSRDDVDMIVLGAKQLVRPYDFETEGNVVVTSVARRNGDAPVVSWQQIGGGELAVISGVGEEGALANLPNGFTMLSNEDVIVAEVYYHFEPLFLSAIFPETTLRKTAVFRPRLGALDTLTGGE